MRTVTLYACSFCNATFETEKKCLAHELEELGVTQEQYQRFLRIRANVCKTTICSMGTGTDPYDSFIYLQYHEARMEAMRFENETGIPMETWEKI